MNILDSDDEEHDSDRSFVNHSMVWGRSSNDSEYWAVQLQHQGIVLNTNEAKVMQQIDNVNELGKQQSSVVSLFSPNPNNAMKDQDKPIQCVFPKLQVTDRSTSTNLQHSSVAQQDHSCPMPVDKTTHDKLNDTDDGVQLNNGNMCNINQVNTPAKAHTSNLFSLPQNARQLFSADVRICNLFVFVDDSVITIFFCSDFPMLLFILNYLGTA